jgi:putative flippase GtrA
LHIWYVASTAIGAFLGAVTNFFLGRHWSFEAGHHPPHGQAMKYAIVATGSLLLNSGGVYLFTDRVGLPYPVSKAITAIIVGLFYNFPMQRQWVFRY